MSCSHPQIFAYFQNGIHILPLFTPPWYYIVKVRSALAYLRGMHLASSTQLYCSFNSKPISRLKGTGTFHFPIV